MQTLMRLLENKISESLERAQDPHKFAEQEVQDAKIRLPVWQELQKKRGEFPGDNQKELRSSLPMEQLGR